MKTWQFLAAMSVMLVLYGVVVVVIGVETSAVGIVTIVVFSAVGFYLGDRVSDRLGGGD